MSTIKASALGPLTGLGASSNTATIVDPATPVGGSAYLGPVVSMVAQATTSGTSFTFSSIPSTYTDLVCIVSGTHTGSGVAGLRIGSINSDGGSNYSDTLLQGNGSSASSAKDTSDTSMNIGLISSTQSNSIFHFMNYSNTTTYKTENIEINSQAPDGPALKVVQNGCEIVVRCMENMDTFFKSCQS